MSGCYYLSDSLPRRVLIKKYLIPSIVNVHTTVQWLASSTTMTQIFENPTTNGSIKELKYAFPLSSGVSVVKFVCIINDREVVGIVTDRQEARKTFSRAIANKETAALIEQIPDAADIFLTTLGYVPSGARITIRLTYVDELAYDLQTNGIRLTVLTHIAPRYGDYPSELVQLPSGGYGTMRVIVDVLMPEGLWIRQIASPSHPISVSLGALSTAISALPNLAAGSALLNVAEAQLRKNLVVNIILNEDVRQPKAFLEEHITYFGQRALMATLMPRFHLKDIRPEIVFVIDCSGSMQQNVQLLRSALQAFLKSLPIGVMFNICCFGSNHKFLWKRSQAYNRNSLAEAMQYALTVEANMGGTEIQQALESAIATRIGKIPLELLLLTDGAIWEPQQLFDSISGHISSGATPLRVFTLGIGDSISDASINGLAQAGRGFAQYVVTGEPFAGKVIRMLKGALSPHIDECTVTIEYEERQSESEDGFDMVDEIGYALSEWNLIDSPEILKEEDTMHRKHHETKVQVAAMEKQKPSRIKAPKALQIHYKLHNIFDFDKTTIYVLLSPNLHRRVPKQVVFRMTSPDGPLELKLDIQRLPQPGELLHQLAARKAIKELENGQGWVRHVIDEMAEPIKESLPDFVKLFERDSAVHLGVRYQVMGRWTSFVAVDKHNGIEHDFEILSDENNHPARRAQGHRGSNGSIDARGSQSWSKSDESSGSRGLSTARGMLRGRGCFSHESPHRDGSTVPSASRGCSKGGRGMPRGGSYHRSSPSGSSGGSSVMNLLHTDNSSILVHRFIHKQSFDGSWRYEDLQCGEMGFGQREFFVELDLLVARLMLLRGAVSEAFATAVVVRYFQHKMPDKVDIWELVVRKAQEWLRNSFALESVELLFAAASKLVSGGK